MFENKSNVNSVGMAQLFRKYVKLYILPYKISSAQAINNNKERHNTTSLF